jgi:selenocysteine-specific elongation factor
VRLGRSLPLRIGDRALLRDAGRHRVAGGVTVLDVAPPALRRRGAAAARAAELAELDGRADLASELRRRLLLRRTDAAAMGIDAEAAAMRVEAAAEPVAGDWFADPGHWHRLGVRLAEEVRGYHADHPLEPGMPVDAARHRLGLPARVLVEALVRPPLTVRGGRVCSINDDVPGELVAAVQRAFDGLGPFAAPEAYDLAALGLGTRQLAAAVRSGLIVQLAPQVVVRADAPTAAVRVLADLPQPFTLSEARRALATTRRVAVPLLELLDGRGLTTRLPDDRRTATTAPG